MVCRQEREDAALARAGRASDGSWYLGRGPGRGVWWCADARCASSLSAGALARALRAPVTEASAGALRALAGSLERR